MKKQKSKKQENLPVYYQVWQEGRYVDLWNVPHFLIGVLLGFIFIFFNIYFSASLFLVFLIKLSWEIYEHIKVIKEAIPNKILDIATGILGYLTLYTFNTYIHITLAGFIAVLVIELILAAWGLYSAKKLDLYIKHE